MVYDPATGNPDGTNRLPFAGNIIPTNRISPIAQKILSLVPGPNQASSEAAPSNNYFALLPYTKDTNSFDVKVDDAASDKARLSARFSYARPVTYQAPIFGLAGGFAQGAFQGTSIQKTYSMGANYNRIFSPTLISEFRVGVAHYHNDAHQTDYGTTASKDIGIPGVNIDSWTSGLASININGGFSTPLVGYVNSLPWSRAEANISVVNSWTKTMGNHTIKWGVDYRRLRDDLLQTQTINPRGLFNFNTAQTSLNPGPGGVAPKTGMVNNMASFLLDQPSDGGRDIAAYFPALRGHQFFAFVQDKWQVSSKLTLDFGLRWEFYPPPTPRFPVGFSNYNPVNNTLVLAGVGGNPMNMGMQKNWKYFAPRLGISYRLNNATVIRTGFGVSYTPFPDNTYAYNFPVKQNNQYSLGANAYAPGVTPSGVFSMASGFPAPQLAVIPSNGIITNPSLTQSNIVVPLNYKNPYVQSWNFSVQRSLPLHFTLDVAYVGNHGVRTSATYNLNVPTTADQMGLGVNGRPEYQQFKRTADTTQYLRRLLLDVQRPAGEVEPPLHERAGHHDLVYAGSRYELPDRRRRRHLAVHQPPPQLRAYGFRPASDVRAKLRLRSALRRRPQVAESRTGRQDDRRLADQRHPDAHDGHADDIRSQRQRAQHAGRQPDGRPGGRSHQAVRHQHAEQGRKPLVLPGQLCTAHRCALRKFGTEYSFRTGLLQRGSIHLQDLQLHGEDENGNPR